MKIRGQYPGPAKLETRDGKAWGEWRSTGNQTVIHGVHPEGMDYRAVNDAPAIELTFGEIVWPDDVVLPWKPRAEIPQDDSADAEKRRRFGEPFFVSESKDGESSRVSGLNESYWAGLYAAEMPYVGNWTNAQFSAVATTGRNTESSLRRERRVGAGEGAQNRAERSTLKPSPDHVVWPPGISYFM